MSMTTLAELKSDIQPAPQPNVAMSMDTVAGFESMQRIANLFSKSTIVPKAYQGNVADCFIAVDMAMRMGANPLMVMQNLYIVHGSPAWSAQFLIATFNKSGRFSALRYEFQGDPKTDDWGCRAVTTELSTKEKLVGPMITISLAKQEGWYGKPGSKWKTMPEQMLRYRAAAWLVRAYAPEIAMGLHTADELEDRTITVDAVAREESAGNSITMDDVKQSTEKPKRARKKAPELPAKESGETIDVAPEPAKQPEPVPAQAETEESPCLDEEPPYPEEACPQEEPMRKAGGKPSRSYGDIICPYENSDGSQRLVGPEDCATCNERPGCPAHEKK